jgi:hypothetical protein
MTRIPAALPSALAAQVVASMASDKEPARKQDTATAQRDQTGSHCYAHTALDRCEPSTVPVTAKNVPQSSDDLL